MLGTPWTDLNAPAARPSLISKCWSPVKAGWRRRTWPPDRFERPFGDCDGRRQRAAARFPNWRRGNAPWPLQRDRRAARGPARVLVLLGRPLVVALVKLTLSHCACAIRATATAAAVSTRSTIGQPVGLAHAVRRDAAAESFEIRPVRSREGDTFRTRRVSTAPTRAGPCGWRTASELAQRLAAQIRGCAAISGLSGLGASSARILSSAKTRRCCRAAITTDPCLSTRSN